MDYGEADAAGEARRFGEARFRGARQALRRRRLAAAPGTGPPGTFIGQYDGGEGRALVGPVVRRVRRVGRVSLLWQD